MKYIADITNISQRAEIDRWVWHWEEWWWWGGREGSWMLNVILLFILQIRHDKIF